MSDYKPKLFTLEVMLDPYDDDVLMEGAQDLTLTHDGFAYANGKYAGKVNLWDYIKNFDRPHDMIRKDYNRFEVEVRGEADRSLAADPVAKRSNDYECDFVCYPAMLPNTEYLCSLELKDDHYDVIYDGTVIGELRDPKNRGVIDKVAKMLSHNWRTTAMVHPTRGKLALYVCIVKA